MSYPKLNIVVDANIPFAQEAFAAFGEVQRLPGSAITAAAVQKADVLIVRSVTRVDRALLAHSRVRFVGTATIGTDHIDLEMLQRRGIAFSAAPGSNAESVVEYVLAVLFTLCVRHARPLHRLTVGVVGEGNVGGRLVRRLRALGTQVLICDPPRAREEGPAGFVDLETLLEACDVVTLHVPLTTTGRDATRHLVGGKALAAMRPHAWIFNTARGSAVDSSALLAGLKQGCPAVAALDVWEGEPAPDPALVAHAALATPHIAGYSFDGKVQGMLDMLRALEKWTGQTARWNAAAALAPAPDDAVVLQLPSPALPLEAYLDTLVRQMYDVQADDARMRVLLGLPREAHAAHFQMLRKTYPRRRRWGLFTLEGPVPEAFAPAIREGLGVQITG